MTEPMCLDWRADGWRVAPVATWPHQLRRSDGRTVLVAAQRPAPPCRYCGAPCHLLDDDHRPVHKVCLEAVLATGCEPTADDVPLPKVRPRAGAYHPGAGLPTQASSEGRVPA